MCGHCGCDTVVDGEPNKDQVLSIEQNILTENNQYADKNHKLLQDKQLFALNLVSSPGSGKTSLLVKTIELLAHNEAIFVIEGDQQTNRDALRIQKTGAKVVQINTGHGCHLDAHQINHVLQDKALCTHEIIFIENVGNLVCPALFDLGEHKKVVVLSVTEGDDKPLKYPNMFENSALMLINKVDLLPYVDFDIQRCIEYAKSINPTIEVIQTSATHGEGLNAWTDWIITHRKRALCKHSQDKQS